MIYETRFDQLQVAPIDLQLSTGLYFVRVESQELNAWLRMQVYWKVGKYIKGCQIIT